MKAVIEYGNKKIEVEGDTVRINKCEMEFSEFEEVHYTQNSICSLPFGRLRLSQILSLYQV